MSNANGDANSYKETRRTDKQAVTTRLTLEDLLQVDDEVGAAPAGQEKSRSLSSHVRSRLPFLTWLPRYGRSDLLGDLIAGITIGLTVIPQGIAYGFLADLPPEYGLYSALLPGLIYLFLGTCPKVTIGPVALLAVMVAPHAGADPAYGALLAFITGAAVTVCGMLRMGYLVDFFSAPVISGFASAAAVVIGSNQVRPLLGITVGASPDLPGVLGTWQAVVVNVGEARWKDATMGVTGIVVLLALRYLGIASHRFRINPYLRKVCWLLSTARNAVVVVTCAAVAAAVDDGKGFILTGSIVTGVPAPRLPALPERIGLGDALRNLGSASVLLPLVAVMQHAAIVKAFSSTTSIKASQEMIALGLTNLLGSFVCSMPVTASFGRTAVNSASGVRTPMGGVFTTILVLLSLFLLMPYCALIPKASLAAVIIFSVLFNLEYEVILPLWKSKKSELIPALATFFCCLFWALDSGVILGIAISLVFVLAEVARPKVDVAYKTVTRSSSLRRVVWLRPDRGLLFPSSASLSSAVNKTMSPSSSSTDLTAAVLDCTSVATLDFTSAREIKELLERWDGQCLSPPLLLYGLNKNNLKTFEGLMDQEKKKRHARDAEELDQMLLKLEEERTHQENPATP